MHKIIRMIAAALLLTAFGSTSVSAFSIGPTATSPNCMPGKCNTTAGTNGTTK